ncbi:MAG: [protein-PII] uridylyltransferase [Verrucomicrobia bacterium]|nr:[protein-PII] uridylyltransferase [Verrucomicrobiota bacterium]
MPDPLPTPDANGRQALTTALHATRSATARDALCGAFLTAGERHLRERQLQERHQHGGGGLEIARARAALMDELLGASLGAVAGGLSQAVPAIALVATGSYGRAALNPCSDLGLMVLLPVLFAKLPDSLQARLRQFVDTLAALGLKTTPTCGSVSECIRLASSDPHLRTSLIDARLVTGDAALFHRFERQFTKRCLDQTGFFDHLRQELRSRHQKSFRTVFLQEPNVKESCGGLNDYHSLLWVCRIKRGNPNLAALVADGILTATARQEIDDAVDFLHRVRNELHYHTQAPTDQLTLMLQGVVSTAFHYPQRSMLRRTEAFMRDYYRHTRNLYQHTTSLMEVFQIEQEDRAEGGLRSFLTFRKKPQEEFDGFIAREGRLHPVQPGIFKDDPQRLMRLFQHCQLRNLRLSPQLRQLVRTHWDDIDRAFRCSRTNRETFQAILERKGDVAATLRKMHRAGFLGRYLPEFGALDCLVQHEFFHRYTADEHTLRCLDQLDQLIGDADPKREIYLRLLHEIADPYALYLAVILHDTGRAENVREHIDGSAMLASRLCNRLQIQGPRRTLIMFLVDHHLTFYRTATTRNLEDPEVIAEFAAIVKSRTNLDALFLFTFADANGTAPEAWSGWKESLMLQLYSATRRFLDGGGRAEYARQLDVDRLALRDAVLKLMRDDYHPDIEQHFARMPAAAFHFRQAPDIVTQVRTVRHFLQHETDTHTPFAHCIKWIDHIEKGYTELVLATRDKPLLLEKLCCALAARHLNILSADFFTRSDGIVVDIFRVCTTNFEPVAEAATRQGFLECFNAILVAAQYDPELHLRRLEEHLTPPSTHDLAVPVQAYVSNQLHPTCTTVEIQALDRIGLLHDLFFAINQHGLNTVHARICTEKGVAMDTLYITTHDGDKVTDPATLASLQQRLASLQQRLASLIGGPEAAP